MASKKKGKRRPPQQTSRQRQAQKARQSRPAQPTAGSGSGSPTTSAGTGALGGGSRPGAKTTPPATKKPPPRERSGPTKAERLAAAERARRRKALRTRVVVGGVVLLLIGAVAAVVINNRRSSSETVSRLEAGSCQFDRSADPDAGAGRNHVASPTYEVNPPAGGDHLPTPAPAGTYTPQNTPPDGQVVHSMEHGYVIVWYRPDLAADAQAQVRQVTDKHAKDVLVVPRASLPKPVAATAWGRRLLCDRVEPAALELFVTTYRNQGPEKVPH